MIVLQIFQQSLQGKYGKEENKSLKWEWGPLYLDPWSTE